MSAGRIAAVAGAAAVLAGCGGSERTPTTSAPLTDPAVTTDSTSGAGRPVTDAEALTLARVLNGNYRAGGARFSGRAPFPQGAVVTLSGRIDWRRLRGRVVFRNPRASGPSATKELVWTKSVVYEQTAPGVAVFSTRAPDPGGSPLDFYISLLARTSSTTIDNIATIKEQGAVWLRADRIGGDAVDVFRYGGDGRSVYWVARDGALRRLEVRIAQLQERTARFDFTDRGPVAIALPTALRTSTTSG